MLVRCVLLLFFFFKQKTAYEMRISDWSSDVCSSDLGPIALIDEAVPVIVLAPSGPLFEKTVSNMQEVMARGGKIVLISDAEGLAEAGEGSMATIEMPRVHPLIAPLVYAVPVQLLAYHVAVAKGTDVDQPRNLAKSVTVE